MTAVRVVWTDGDCPPLDLCLVRTTWDYFERLPDFLAWVARAATRTPVLNAPAVIRWNADKHYLLDLHARGVPIPPTIPLAAGPVPDLAALLRQRDWPVAMLKPMVGVGAIGSFVARLGDPAPGQAHLAGLLAKGDVLVQPFLRSIHSAGEASLVFFDGQLSHAVRKVPAQGDYRAHPYWGAVITALEPSAAQLTVARAALAAAASPPLYGRVDLVALDDSSPAVMELELIEPYLFLDGASAQRFARAVTARLGRRAPH